MIGISRNLFYIFVKREYIRFSYQIPIMKSVFKSDGENYSLSLKLLLSIVLITVFLFVSKVEAQADYSSNPVWIKMIDDSTANYYVVMKAYNEYWKTHVKPSGEEEEMAEGEKDSKERARETRREIKKDRKKTVTEEDLKKQNENNLIKYHVKRFEQWTRDVKPFVQEDGRILTNHERMEIWNKQQEEMKQQQK